MKNNIFKNESAIIFILYCIISIILDLLGIKSISRKVIMFCVVIAITSIIRKLYIKKID